MGCLPYQKLYKLLGTAPKPLSAVIVHRNELTAEIEFKNWFEKDVLVHSPFFKNIPHKPPMKVKVSGPVKNVGIGSDIIFACMK